MSDLKSEQVAAFLKAHPDFLLQHPALTASLKLPASDGGTTSLAAYQLDVLREKNRDLSARMQTLIAAAQSNEVLLHRAHLLSLRLIKARSLIEAVQQVAASMREDFQTHHVRLLLLGFDGIPEQEFITKVPAQSDAWQAFDELRRHQEPRCGRMPLEQLNFLFGAEAARIASSVVLPLADFGLLAVGSEDANRFHPGMGTVFLKLMAEQIAASLAMLSERSG